MPKSISKFTKSLNFICVVDTGANGTVSGSGGVTGGGSTGVSVGK